MTIPIKLSELEAKAREATQVEYWTYNGAGIFSKGEEGVQLVDENGETSDDDLNYIAAANPLTISRLCEALRIAVESLNFHIKSCEVKAPRCRVCQRTTEKLTKINDLVDLS